MSTIWIERVSDLSERCYVYDGEPMEYSYENREWEGYCYSTSSSLIELILGIKLPPHPLLTEVYVCKKPAAVHYWEPGEEVTE